MEFGLNPLKKALASFGLISSFAPAEKASVNPSYIPQGYTLALSSGTGTLGPIPMPKSKPKPQAIPGFRTSVEVKTSAIARNDRVLATADRLTARTLGDTRKTVLELTKGSPDLSSAVSMMQRTGIPEEFKLVARNLDGSINPEATALAGEVLVRLTYLGSAEGKFTSAQGLQSLSEKLTLELQMYGAMCLEVALDQARVPASFNPVSITTLKLYEEGSSFRLVQDIGGDEIDLNLPTVIYTTIDQIQTEAYPSSYLESAIQPLIADIDFNNDMRRLLKRAVWPKLMAVINSETVRKNTPPEVLADDNKLLAYRLSLIEDIAGVLSNANPEDAIVGYDEVTYSYMQNSSDPGQIVESFQKVLNGKLAAGAKTLPIILGHGGTSNAASAESMLYLKQANMLRVKLNELYSRAFTVALRLLGQDVYVEFRYDQINLRPDLELEAFRAQKQARMLELLSWGMVSDEVACLELTNHLPPVGYKPLMGTGFYKANAQEAKNLTSNTSAMEQELKSDVPSDKKD